MKILRLCLLLIWLMTAALGEAASFSCNGAVTRLEALICSNEELSGLDEQLATAYRSALQLTSNAERLKGSQIAWLAQREQCNTAACLANTYRARIQVLAQSKSGRTETGGHWTYRWGGKEPLCQAIIARLNRFDRNEDVQNRCSREVIASHPGFESPSWQTLDPREHQEMIARMLRYTEQTPDKYFQKAQGSEQSLASFQEDALELIQKGVRLRALHLRLLSHFKANSGAVVESPSSPQTVVQLYMPMSEDASGAFCVGKPKPLRVNDFVQTFIFTDDLVGPDPRVDTATAFTLGSRDLLFFNGNAILVGQDSVWQDGPLGLEGVCSFQFVQGNK
jgi:uncharacterized protein